MSAELLLREFDRVAGAPDAVPRLRQFVFDLAVAGMLSHEEIGIEPKPWEQRESPLRDVQKEQRGPRFAREGWRRVTVGSMAHMENGDRGKNYPSKQHRVQSGIPFVNAGHLRDDHISESDLDFISQQRFESLRAGKFVRGDILFCLRGSLGKVALVSNLDGGAIASSLIILRPLPGLAGSFLHLCLKSSDTSSQIKQFDNGTAQPNLAGKDLSRFQIPLPPLSVQHRIVAKVDELIALCDQLEAAQKKRESRRDRLRAASLHRLAATDESEGARQADVRFFLARSPRLITKPEHVAEVRQTILDLAVRGRLVPQVPGDETAWGLLTRIAAARGSDPRRAERAHPIPPSEKPEPQIASFSLPPSWAWTPWEDIALKIGDIDHAMPDAVASGGYPYVSPRDFRPGNRIDFGTAKKISHGDFTRLAAKIRPELGDLIYPRYGTIGETRMVLEDRDFLASYSCAVIKVLKPFVDPAFQYIFSISDIARSQATASINQATQPNVGIKSIKQFLFPLPPIEEQHRIVAKVDVLMSVCDNVESALATTRMGRSRLLESLLHEALGGAPVPSCGELVGAVAM